MGTFRNGFFKIINPIEYGEVIDLIYSGSSAVIPLFATGMGDIITWEENTMFVMVSFGMRRVEGVCRQTDSLWKILENKRLCKKIFL
jgi:hypothetical protein